MVMSGANGLDPVTESMMQWIQQQNADRREDYELARRYYHGDHDTAITDRLKKFLPPRLAFRDNFMNVVVDTLSERLKVIGFESENETLGQAMWDLWNDNRMDYTQNVIHTETIMLGDSYILCDWDEENQRPRWSHQKAEMILPHYNEATRKMDWASKKWLQAGMMGEEPITRLNIYYPDRVEKYMARGGVWRRFQDETDESWPIPWVTKEGAPLGIPFIHFRNRPLGEDFGQSEIINVIPMQDLLNKSLIDLTMILDTLAFPQRYTLNVNHGASRLDILPGSVTEFHSEYDGGQVGQWNAAFGTSEFNDEEVGLDTLWDDPETRNEQSHLESLRIKAELGVSRDQILSELGYDDDQIAQMRIATRIEQRAQSNIGAELLRQFDAGNPEEEA